MKRNLSAPPKLKRLLAATDLSPRAQRALRRAVLLAEDHHATVTILHVVEKEYDEPRFRERIEFELGRQTRSLGIEPQGKHSAVRIIRGKAFLEIIRHARKQAAELIVVGAHGADYFKELLIGTTVEKIVRKGDRPVLVVRRPPAGPYRRALVAVDFSEDSRYALEFALRLAPRAQIHVLHVCQGFEGQLTRAGLPRAEIVRHLRRTSTLALRELDLFLGKIEDRVRPIRRDVVTGRTRHEIVTFARSIHADLIAVGTSGRSGVPYVLLGSVAEHVLREASCDVLVAQHGRSRFRLP
jgi:nucleotide-binding universal stress UspA family protein